MFLLSITKFCSAACTDASNCGCGPRFVTISESEHFAASIPFSPRVSYVPYSWCPRADAGCFCVALFCSVACSDASNDGCEPCFVTISESEQFAFSIPFSLLLPHVLCSRWPLADVGCFCVPLHGTLSLRIGLFRSCIPSTSLISMNVHFRLRHHCSTD